MKYTMTDLKFRKAYHTCLWHHMNVPHNHAMRNLFDVTA